MTITNIAAYKFAPLTDLKPLREELIRDCKASQLKGTILLSPEGVNLFVAGLKPDVEGLLEQLRSVPGLEGLQAKFSDSDHQPFHRMLVKIKKEIIAFGIDGIDPAGKPAPRVTPRELKQWLDEGRPITLLDTRNDYEVALGTFHGAIPAGIQHFRDFPQAVEKLPENLKHQPIVTFCTGGIRCEKAAPCLIREGFENVFQLDGGILKYFEECGSDHYDGECFVFDHRVGVDPSLHETDTTQCHVCQVPLTTTDQEDPRYVEGRSCPYCYRSSEEQRAEAIRQRQVAIQRITAPLPGSQPYDNFRPVKVPPKFNGNTLLECLCGLFPHVGQGDWQRHCDEGRMLAPDGQAAAAGHIVRTGERYLQRKPETIEPDVNVDIRILYEDEAILVLHKPAPLPMHPCGRFNRNTLQYILAEAYHQPLQPENMARTGSHARRGSPDPAETPDRRSPLRPSPEDFERTHTTLAELGANRQPTQSIASTPPPVRRAPQSQRPAHRLDANTSGVVVFSRTKHVASLLQPQFERGEVQKVYLARVLGHPPEDDFECQAPISDSSGDLGSRDVVTEGGLPAHTLFKVLSRSAEGTSLLEVQPLTGRTNQIRVHLWHLGWPICGDQAYLPGRMLGETQTHAVNDPPLCLLARRITFTHPLSRDRMTFEADLPDWAS